MSMAGDERMESLIQEAYEQIPVYLRNGRDMNRKEEQAGGLEDYPVLERNQLIEEETAVLMPWAEMLRMQGKLICGRTSGSSGKYMEIFWTREDYHRSMLPLWFYRYKYYGIRPDDRVCYFYTIRSLDGMEDMVQRKAELGFSKSNLTMQRISRILDKMEEFQPEWLMLQPSVAMLLCRCMDRCGKKAPESIRYIEFTGEILTPEVRKTTREHFFGTGEGQTGYIANQYGANEFNSIAYECPQGKLHIMKDNVVVEVLDSEKRNCRLGQEGELYLTTKTNRAMPLIRYRIGDRGCLCDESCSCGNKGKVLQLASGRANDWILYETEDGRLEKITPNVFVRTFDSINYKLDGAIKQFRVEQKGKNSFHIILVLEEDDGYLEQEVEKLFYQGLEDVRLKEAEYRFCYREELLPDEDTGKIRWFWNYN